MVDGSVVGAGVLEYGGVITQLYERPPMTPQLVRPKTEHVAILRQDVAGDEIEAQYMLSRDPQQLSKPDAQIAGSPEEFVEILEQQYPPEDPRLTRVVRYGGRVSALNVPFVKLRDDYTTGTEQQQGDTAQMRDICQSYPSVFVDRTPQLTDRDFHLESKSLPIGGCLIKVTYKPGSEAERQLAYEKDMRRQKRLRRKRELARENSYLREYELARFCYDILVELERRAKTESITRFLHRQKYPKVVPALRAATELLQSLLGRRSIYRCMPKLEKLRRRLYLKGSWEAISSRCDLEDAIALYLVYPPKAGEEDPIAKHRAKSLKKKRWLKLVRK